MLHCMRNVARRAQLSGLRDALPCHWGSAVAVRVDAACSDLLRACIVGANGTPYAGGCFLFDICLPATYPDACVRAPGPLIWARCTRLRKRALLPAADDALAPTQPQKITRRAERRPPRVAFLTTGGGVWAANPNLYNNGTVCLSLLGTWSGPGWQPGRSTLLQLLVSLQALVLNTQPYFNEPAVRVALPGVAETSFVTSSPYLSRAHHAAALLSAWPAAV